MTSVVFLIHLHLVFIYDSYFLYSKLYATQLHDISLLQLIFYFLIVVFETPDYQIHVFIQVLSVCGLAGLCEN